MLENDSVSVKAVVLADERRGEGVRSQDFQPQLLGHHRSGDTVSMVSLHTFAFRLDGVHRVV